MLEHFEKNPDHFLFFDLPSIAAILIFAALCGIITHLLLQD
jgi:hypothetical protein